MAKVGRDGSRRFLYEIWQPLTLFISMLAFAIAFFPFVGPDGSIDHAEDAPLFFCNADGNIEKQPRDGHELFWDPRLFFTANMAYGRLSFTIAKFIDACWDLVVGRGGQLLTAMLAYRYLRRSFTLVLEQNTTSIATFTSICCHQIHIASTWQLVRAACLPHSWRSPLSACGVRLAANIFVCSYVLAFATLVSVMAGYRAQLTGVFGYVEGNASQLMPLSDIHRPQLIVYDGTRIGLPDDRMEIAGVIPVYYIQSTFMPISSYLQDSGKFGNTYGTLIDYYFTCLGLARFAIFYPEDSSPANATITLKCAEHECSCSLSPSAFDVLDKPFYDSNEMYDGSWMSSKMASNLSFGGRTWELDAPPLDIATALHTADWADIYKVGPVKVGDFAESMNATVLWRSYSVIPETEILPARPYDASPIAEERSSLRSFEPQLYAFDGTTYEETYVSQTGRCIANDAYSWGFSSLLLLTFCCYTLLFAATLIALQADVYWNSRSARDTQPHSIYHDIFFIADELRSRFGQDFDLQPARTLEKQVDGCKTGMHISSDALPPSRYAERRTKRSAREECVIGMQDCSAEQQEQHTPWPRRRGSMPANERTGLQYRLRDALSRLARKEGSTPRITVQKHPPTSDDQELMGRSTSWSGQIPLAPMNTECDAASAKHQSPITEEQGLLERSTSQRDQISLARIDIDGDIIRAETPAAHESAGSSQLGR